MGQKRIYLANNIGFSRSQAAQLRDIETELTKLGYKVLEPFKRNNTGNKSAPEICLADLKDIEDCDAIFAVVNGEPPDVGVAVEVGYAAALGKKIFLFRDDFRQCSDSANYPINLMFMAGDSVLYTHESEFLSEHSGLARFAKEK